MKKYEKKLVIEKFLEDAQEYIDSSYRHVEIALHAYPGSDCESQMWEGRDEDIREYIEKELTARELTEDDIRSYLIEIHKEEEKESDFEGYYSYLDVLDMIDDNYLNN